MITGKEDLRRIAAKFPSARDRDLSGIVGIISIRGESTAILVKVSSKPADSAVVCSQGQTHRVALPQDFCEAVPLR